MEIYKHIINTHGRVDNITLYNRDPYPPRKAPPNDKKELKPRVPPFRHLERLLKLQEEQEIVNKKKEQFAKKMADAKANGEYVDDKAEAEFEKTLGDLKKFDVLNYFEFPTFEPGQGKDPEHVIHYNESDISLHEITDSYGTIVRPNIDPKKDPLPPEPKEPASPSKIEATE